MCVDPNLRASVSRGNSISRKGCNARFRRGPVLHVVLIAERSGCSHREPSPVLHVVLIAEISGCSLREPNPGRLYMYTVHPTFRMEISTATSWLSSHLERFIFGGSGSVHLLAGSDVQGITYIIQNKGRDSLMSFSGYQQSCLNCTSSTDTMNASAG
jgi:hypothetical protein